MTILEAQGDVRRVFRNGVVGTALLALTFAIAATRGVGNRPAAD